METIVISLCRYDKDIEKDFTATTGNLNQDLFYCGEIVIYFSNLGKNEDLVEKIKKCFITLDNKISVEKYFQNCIISLNKIIPNKFSEIIVMDAQNNYISKNEKSTPLIQSKILNDSLINIISLSNTISEMFALINTDKKYEFVCKLFFETLGNLDNSIEYGVYPMIKDNKMVLIDIFSAKSETSLVELDAVNMFKNDIQIKKCQNCGKYFIPISRNDEKYCDNIFRNGKTCKELGYYEKVVNDDILKTYRTAYKTQNARKQRNKYNIPDADIRFQKWVDFAKNELEKCKKSEITVQEFKRIISSDSWLRGD